jgi:hypothetical protein
MQEFADNVGDHSNDWSYADAVAGFAIARFVDSEARSFDGAKIERASCAVYLLFIFREKAEFLTQSIGASFIGR